ncbi:hypothetical protein LCGC14_1795340 [marine sediment metagenome]|uniref:Uncharacterized protein n=1 Tax=marine sediment metagenome TaxID=412755 RepID=A0A0F9J631_9ZZZZ
MIATKCPLCEADLDSLYNKREMVGCSEGSRDSGYHYRCPWCHHGWYVADLQNMDYMRLEGYSDEEIKEILLKEDRK